MMVHLYALSWNDGRMVDYFLRHYEPFVDRFFIYDDGSTDGTRDTFAARDDVELRPQLRRYPESWVKSALHFYNECWMESRGVADWVFIVNLDEHLYHPRMRDYLSECRAAGVTAIPSLGFQMVSAGFPDTDVPLYRELTMGAPWSQMSKMQIFNPNAVIATNFGPGRHRARFEGDICIPQRNEVLNLHYKYLGLDRLHDRHGALRARLGPLDIQNRWGHRYHFSRQELGEDYDSFAAASLDVFAEGYSPDRDYVGDRWFKGYPAAVVGQPG
ncbi:MAG: glycosyltransferase family 2 protein [Chromatiales bacterium]|nr:glycosyltransferase family 2 protein [Chromatiales bacterium]